VFLLSLVLIFLVLAAQFNSFRDPFIILLGSVPLAMFGAGLFMFLKMPFGQFFTDRWTTSFNIYSQVGLVTLVADFQSGTQKNGPDRRSARCRHPG
jgi:multidrug efflux pump